jgi:micrococcal nuclease
MPTKLQKKLTALTLLVLILILNELYPNLSAYINDFWEVNNIKQEKVVVSDLNKTVVVARVIDGDTVELSTGEKVRYIGIDTPEVNNNSYKSQCFATQAKAANKRLVLGKQVILEKDVSNTDRYDRLLRYVYVVNKTGKKIFINKQLVKEGYATVFTYPPDVRYAEVFVKAEKHARNNNKGLWAMCR